jgi:hypothetical protein
MIAAVQTDERFTHDHGPAATITRQCTACARTIVPGDGPSLLWAPRDGSRPRQAWHLSCWQRWQRWQSGARPPSAVKIAAVDLPAA